MGTLHDWLQRIMEKQLGYLLQRLLPSKAGFCNCSLQIVPVLLVYIATHWPSKQLA